VMSISRGSAVSPRRPPAVIEEAAAGGPAHRVAAITSL
jgi:hypothetical protein